MNMKMRLVSTLIANLIAYWTDRKAIEFILEKNLKLLTTGKIMRTKKINHCIKLYRSEAELYLKKEETGDRGDEKAHERAEDKLWNYCEGMTEEELEHCEGEIGVAGCLTDW